MPKPDGRRGIIDIASDAAPGKPPRSAPSRGRKLPPIPDAPPENTAPPVPANPSERGVPVLGIEPYLEKGEVGVVVAEGAFAAPPFGTMTLALGDTGSDRHYLRSVGSDRAGAKRVLLRLKCRDGAEAGTIVDAYLTSGGARIFAGVKE
jgi:hypothetical protein